MHLLRTVSAVALALAAVPAVALDAGPGQRPSNARDPSTNFNMLGAGRLSITGGAGSVMLGATPLSDLLLNALPSGRKAVEQGDASDLRTAGRSMAARALDTIKVKDFPFLATCDGVADDTTALLTWAAYITAHPGVRGELPAGTCTTTSTITFFPNYYEVVGQGAYASTILYTGTATNVDIVQVGTGGPNASPAAFRGFRIASNTKMTDGSGLHVNRTAYVNFRDVVADGQNGNGKLWNAIWFDKPGYSILDGWDARAQNDALRVSADGIGSGPQFDLWAINGKASLSGVGVHVGGGVDNIHFDKSMISTNTNNVVIDTAISPYRNQEISFGRQFIADQALQSNYVINDAFALNDGFYCNINISGPVTGAKALDGIRVLNWPGCYLTVDSPHISYNHNNGIDLEDASTRLTVGASTVINGNTNWGIYSGSATTSVRSAARVEGNGTGSYKNLVGLSYNARPGGPVSPVSIGASPFTFAAPMAGTMFLGGGTVSALVVTRAGSEIFISPSTAAVPLKAGDLLAIAYSAAPDAKFLQD